LTAFSIVVHPEAVTIYPDEYRLVEAYETCHVEERPYYIFVALFAIEKFGLLLFGSALALKVRKIKFSVLNESNVIAFAIYNVFFFSLLTFLVHVCIPNSSKSTRNALFLFRSISLIFGVGKGKKKECTFSFSFSKFLSVSTVSILFINKVRLIRILNGDTGSLDTSRSSKKIIPTLGQSDPSPASIESRSEKGGKASDRTYEELEARYSKLKTKYQRLKERTKSMERLEKKSQDMKTMMP